MAAHTDPRLSRFCDELLPIIIRRFAPERVIAFGSRVRGDALSTSDLDVVVIAPAFEGVPWLDRAVMVQEAIGAPFAIDVLCYAPDEFERKASELGVVRAAARDGIELYRAA